MTVGGSVGGGVHATEQIRIPFDPQSPFVTGGLRLGSPAMTTRGMNSIRVY